MDGEGFGGEERHTKGFLDGAGSGNADARRFLNAGICAGAVHVSRTAGGIRDGRGQAFLLVF